MSRGMEVQGLVWVAVSRRFELLVILAFSQSMYRDRLEVAMRSMIDRKILNMSDSKLSISYGLQDATGGCRFLSALHMFNYLPKVS